VTTQPHQRLWDLGRPAPAAAFAPRLLPAVDVEHPLGAMDPAYPQRFRLSAIAERRAARSWLGAAVAAHSTVEVLACTQLGRTALRQAHEYDELADELETAVAG
jgi:hypothetical protein